MEIDEILESPGFWILGLGGLTAEIMGYVYRRNQGWVTMPIWQLGVMMIVTLAAAAFFATKE